ncbi:hypothetical protein TNCV_2623631 [Trichonephila clavipes]|nr:hypothetical protein TNCV_2623631 [Trichonephila clavipes]
MSENRKKKKKKSSTTGRDPARIKNPGGEKSYFSISVQMLCAFPKRSEEKRKSRGYGNRTTDDISAQEFDTLEHRAVRRTPNTKDAMYGKKTSGERGGGVHSTVRDALRHEPSGPELRASASVEASSRSRLKS